MCSTKLYYIYLDFLTTSNTSKRVPCCVNVYNQVFLIWCIVRSACKKGEYVVFFLIRQTASNSVEYNYDRAKPQTQCNNGRFSMRKETEFRILINIAQNSQALLSVIMRARRFYKAKKLNFVLTMFKSLGAIITAYALITR